MKSESDVGRPLDLAGQRLVERIAQNFGTGIAFGFGAAKDIAERIVRSELAASRPGEPWQRIESAPQDGTIVLGGWPHGVQTVHYEGGQWRDFDSYPLSKEPTFWLPLPAPPKDADQ